MSAERYNTGKKRWSLVDFRALEGMVDVLEFGAKKYDEHNWKKGQKVTTITESLMRHLVDFLEGIDNDEETGLPHVDHIMCNAMFLAHMAKREEWDDRPNKLNK